MTITVGSLFTGIGGLDLGLERAGMEIRWMVEIDPFCQKVLAKHWPNVTRYKDVKECGKHNLETVDLICGGFPCQPHSLAGKRRGAADDRNLWPEYLRIVTELRPTWILGENVPGIISTMLNTVLSDLENEGYETLPLIVPACAFNAPHRRERIFIIAHSSGLRCHAGWPEQSLQGTGQSGKALSQTLGKVVAHAEGQRTGDECKNIRQTSRKVNASDDTGGIGGGNDQSINGKDVANTTRVSDSGISNNEDSKPHKEHAGEPRGGSLEENGEAHLWCAEQRICGMANGLSQGLDGLDKVDELYIEEEETINLQSLWKACTEIGYVPETLSALPQIWQSLTDEEKTWVRLRISTGTPWCSEWPRVPRVITGQAHRVDRLRSLGNAVVPAVAQFIGERIIQCHLANTQRHD